MGLAIPLKYDFDGFQQYLLSQGMRNSKQLLSYAIRYGYILHTTNASELLTFPNSKRHHAMESLACLSKYLGCYDTWKQIRQRYQLKWSTEDSLHIFTSIINNKNNFSAMLAWLKNTCSTIPESYAKILIYDTLTGLRPSEACQSLKIIHTDLSNYLNSQTGTLEHFRYPEIFIRRTKKAFISILTDSVLEIAKRAGQYRYNVLSHVIERRGLNMHMAYCRKIFATHLRNSGIQPELIDLLQGRVPKSVFTRHYFRPDFDYKQIRDSITSLHDTINKQISQ